MVALDNSPLKGSLTPLHEEWLCQNPCLAKSTTTNEPFNGLFKILFIFSHRGELLGY